MSGCDFSAAEYLGVGTAIVRVLFRGGNRELDVGDSFISIEYSRAYDGYGEATVVIPAGACCAEEIELGDIDPLAHELVIERSDDTETVKLGFVGPILRVIYAADKVTIYARSLDWWWGRVVVLGGYEGHPRSAMEEIITTTEAQLSLGMNGYPIVRDDDELIGERIPERVQAADLVDDLVNAGLHYTMVGRSVIYGEVLHESPATAVMTTFGTEHFIGDSEIELIKSGLNYSSRVTMIDRTTASGYVTVDDSVPEDYYGVAENLYTSRSRDDAGVSIRTQANQVLIAQSRPKVTIPDTTQQLSASAPVTFDELIPGMPVRFAGEIGCIAFDELMSIGTITYRYQAGSDESISVELSPVTATDGATGTTE